MREIDHAGHDHVVVVGVVLVFVQKRPDLVCTDLSVVVRQRQDFVSAELDRTGLVYADVPGACGDHALIAFQHGVDHRGVCLRAAIASEEASCIPLPPGRRKLHIRSLLLTPRCAARRDLSGGRVWCNGQLESEIFRVKFRTTVRTGPLSFLGRLKPFFSFWQRKKRMGSKKGR